MIVGITAGARPATSLVAPPSKPYYGLYPPPPKVFLNQTQIRMRARARARAFPALSLPRTHRRSINNQSPLLLFREQLQFICLSAFPSPQSQINSNNNNNKSRFLALAPVNSYDHDIKQQEEEENEENAKVSSKVPLKIPSYLKLVTGSGFWAQLICTHIAFTIAGLMRVFTDFLSSGPEKGIMFCLMTCAFTSTCAAGKRYLFVAEEHRKLTPRSNGETLMKHFIYGVLTDLCGMCLSILAMRSSANVLKMHYELGFTSSRSILKSFTPGSLFVAFEASTFLLLTHVLGLASSLCCYDRRDPNHPLEAPNPDNA